MEFPRIVHVALTVPDLAESVAWYSELFGGPPAMERDEIGFRSAVWLRPLIGLHQFPDPVDVRFDERVTGLDHVAFGCADRAELEHWEARLDELGVEHGGIVDLDYGSGLSFRDLNNIALEFFCRPAAVTQ